MSSLLTLYKDKCLLTKQYCPRLLLTRNIIKCLFLLKKIKTITRNKHIQDRGKRYKLYTHEFSWGPLTDTFLSRRLPQLINGLTIPQLIIITCEGIGHSAEDVWQILDPEAVPLDNNPSPFIILFSASTPSPQLSSHCVLRECKLSSTLD